MEQHDVIVIGAGAAGLMCAIEAGKRGRKVALLEQAKNPGEKIRISGGGRCNFTNIHTGARNFLSANPHFCKSALARYTPKDFITLVQKHGIAFHEKALGQLFCDGWAQQIIDMLLSELRQAGGHLRLSISVTQVEKTESGFRLTLADGTQMACASLVVATGGKSIPKLGSDFGYRLAAQFGVPVTETRPGLVPLIFDAQMLARLSPLSGIALPSRVSCGKVAFDEAMLFTHRGLSGPAILQISSYWHEGEDIVIDLLPEQNAFERLRAARKENPRRHLSTLLSEWFAQKLGRAIAEEEGVTLTLGEISDAVLRKVGERLNRWRVTPAGSEGYRTAEVTLGGVDTDALDSKTMQAKAVPGLYFIGEVVDVTGWLGGYNFQWAWSSGWSAGQTV